MDDQLYIRWLGYRRMFPTWAWSFFWMKYNCIEVNLVDITKETEKL